MAEDYKIVSQQGKGLATGDAAKANEERIATDADFRQSELARTAQVIQDRKAAGADISAQEAYQSRLSSFDAPAPVETAPQQDSYQQLIDLTLANQRAQTEALTKANQASYQSQVNNVESAYASSVADQERLKAQANTQYDTNIDSVDQGRYAESEGSAVRSEQRGIGNSAQFDALERGTVSRASRLKLQAAKDRDTTLNDIGQRIANLGLQKNLAINTAGANRDLATAQGTANIASEAFAQQFGLGQQQLGQEYQTSEREASQDYATSEREAGQAFSAEQAGVSREFQAFMQQQGFNHDITMFDKNSALQKYMQASSQAFQASENDRQRANAKEDEAYSYALNLSRDLNKFTPGTAEYDAIQGALKMESDKLRMQADANFESKKKWAEFETELAGDEYTRNLERQMSQYSPGTMEYAIAEANRNQQKQDWISKTQYEVQAQHVAEATQEQLVSQIGSNYPSQLRQYVSFVTEALATKLTPGESFDQWSVDQLRDRGILIPTKNQLDAEAYYGSLYEMDLINRSTYNDLTN